MAPTPTVPKANCVSGTSTVGTGPVGWVAAGEKSPARQGRRDASSMGIPPPSAVPKQAAVPATIHADGKRIVPATPLDLEFELTLRIVASSTLPPARLGANFKGFRSP